MTKINGGISFLDTKKENSITCTYRFANLIIYGSLLLKGQRGPEQVQGEDKNKGKRCVIYIICSLPDPTLQKQI